MEQYFIAFWNAENLFDVENSSTRPDWLQDELSSELRGWDQIVLERKISQLARIIRQLNGGQGFDVLGLCEIENQRVVDLLVSSLNMLGQISRLQGQTKEALEAFEEMANLVEPHLLADSKSAASASTELWCSALFSRAEILEMEQDYTASIAEYNRLLKTLNKNRDRDIFEQYGPLVNDRIFQLHIRQRDRNNVVSLQRRHDGDSGPYFKRWLPEIPSKVTQRGTWKKEFPDSWILK